MKKWIKWGILVLCVVVLAVLLAFLGKEDISFSWGDGSSDQPKKNGVLYTASLDSSVSYQFIDYKGGILSFSGDELQYFDRNLGSKWKTALGSVSSILSAEGDYILVAARNGKDAKLFKGNKEVASVKNNTNILGASVNADGRFLLISEEKGYKGKVTLYNAKGEEEFKWFSGTKNIIDADISPNNKTILVSMLDLTLDHIRGNVTFLEVGQDAPVASYDYDNNATTKAQFYSDGSSCVLGDTSLLFYNSKGTLSHSIEFGGRTLQQADLEEQDNIVLALAGAQGGLDKGLHIITYNRKGTIKGECTLDDTVKLFDARGGFTAVNKDQSIVLINGKGQEVASITPNKEVKQILLYPDKSKILLISAVAAEVMKFDR